MSDLSRRDFVKTSIVAGAALGGTLTSLVSRGASVSASEKIHVACIGVRGRGDSVMRTFAAQNDVVITHVCDIDRGVLESRAAALEKATGHKAKAILDYREALDDKAVDAVMIATPDHWHALPAIHGAMAGKDVYVEKPDGHNINEGKMMVAAARKYERMMQMGTQLRSAPWLHELAKFVADGGIGKVLYGKAWESARQGAIPKVPDSEPPAGVDYDRWLGPAPLRPFNRYRFHGNWRWFFDYGSGDLGNDGVHRMDYARMVMGITDMPRRIICSGGKLFFDDAQEWPDTQIATYEFGGSAGAPEKVLTYEMRIWSRPRLHGATEGAAVYGENGWVLIDNSGYKVFDPSEKVIKESGGSNPQTLHVRNFLDAMRSRKHESLNQEIASGHVSSVMCHAGNIAWRTGLSLDFDARTETFAQKEANAMLGRTYRKGYELPAQL